MMRRKKEEEGGGPNWLDTYADMVTLLLTFFVLLFSFSSINADKWKIIVDSLKGTSADSIQIVVPGATEVGTGVVPPAGGSDGNGVGNGDAPNNPTEIKDLDDLYAYLMKYVADNNLQNDVDIKKGDGFTFITFRNNIFFSGNSSVLREQGKEVLNVLVDAFSGITDQIGAIRFDGHTARADDKSADNHFDWQLSADRAVNVLFYVDEKNVIDPAKLTATGHGEYLPVVPHDGTEATRIQNRRVEIYIEGVDSETLSLEEVYQKLDEQQAAQ